MAQEKACALADLTLNQAKRVIIGGIRHQREADYH